MAGLDGNDDETETPDNGVTIDHLAGSPGAPALKVSGQLDVSTEAHLREEIDHALAEQPSRIVLEVSELTFMDSSGLAVLLAAARRATVELRNPTDIIRRLIEIAGLGDTLHLVADA